MMHVIRGEIRAPGDSHLPQVIVTYYVGSSNQKTGMDSSPKYRFDPVYHNFMRIRGRRSPGERLQAMLAAREWVFAAQRARLKRLYPDLSPVEINLRVLEEIDRAERRQFTAWCETRVSTGTTPTTWRFTGQREDATIGLYHYSARY